MPILLTRDGQWVDAAGNVHAGSDGFVLGVTEPTAANTGPRVAEASLSNYAGSLTNVTTGDTIDRLAITGRIVPNAGGVTFRDTLVLGGMPDGSPSSPSVANTWALVDSRSGSVTTPNLYEHCEIRPSYLSHDIYGFRGGNIDAYRCKIWPVIDAFSVHGSGTYPANTMKIVRIRGCYAERSHFEAVDPRQGPEGSHGDTVQPAGALSELTIIGNALWGGNTSCILLQKNGGPYGMVTIEDNWLYGHPDAGATLHMSESLQGGTTQGYGPGELSVKRNRIDRGGNSPRVLIKSNSRFPANFGCTGTDGSNPSTWTPGPDANVWMDDGTPATLNAG